MNEESKKYAKCFIIGFLIISIIYLLFSCTCKKISCPTYKDNYQRHWLNEQNNTNILFSDNELKSKWDKRR